MSSYPILTAQAAQQIASHRLEAASDLNALQLDDPTTDVVEHESSVEAVESDADIDVRSKLRECQEQIDAITSHRDTLEVADVHEGQAAVLLYECVTAARIPTSVLDDRRFWTHLSLTHLWNFTTRRQSQSFLTQLGADAQADSEIRSDADAAATTKPPSYMRYLDGSNSRHCVASRMYLRMKCLGGSDEAELAYAVKRGADFWQSHILRVKQGEHPAIVRAMVRRQANDDTYLETQPLREFAKWLNLESQNLELAYLSPTDQEALVARLWLKALNYQGQLKQSGQNENTEGQDREQP